MKAKRTGALILALALCLSLGAHAAGSTTATVPVTLTVDNEYRAVNVTVPASLPIEVITGTVLTAENARITNNSKSGSVRVSGVEVTDGAYKVGSYNSFSGAKTIALKINGCPRKAPASSASTPRPSRSSRPRRASRSNTSPKSPPTRPTART